MTIADAITDFLAGLKSNSKGTVKNDTVPPIYVERSPAIKPNPNPRLAAIQPKIERDLVKTGELPTLAPSEANKLSLGENLKDLVGEGDYVTAYSSKYGIKDKTVAKTIYDTARKYGESPELLFKIANHESNGFDPRAVNPNTKASGLFQFLPSTWKDVQDRLGGREQGIVDPFNPEHNTKAAALYVQDIKKRLSKVKDGSKITDQDIYLGHFSGAGRASQVIKALETGRGKQLAKTVYSPNEIVNNQPVFYHMKTIKVKDKNGRLVDKSVPDLNKPKTIKEVYDTITYNVNKEDTQDISMYLPKTKEV